MYVCVCAEGSEGVSDGEGQDEDDDADMIAAANKLEARRREQAAGDHPLQDSFRWVSLCVCVCVCVCVTLVPLSYACSHGSVP